VRVGELEVHEATPDKKMKDKIVNEVIAKAMGEARVTFEDVTHYSVVVGPGSWTGARVGVAVIKALALVLPRPIFAVREVTREELEPFYDSEFVVSTKKRDGSSK